MPVGASPIQQTTFATAIATAEHSCHLQCYPQRTTFYFLSFPALKLLGTEGYVHVGEHAFDPALGLFAGLNVLPKGTALSTYSYSLDEMHLTRLQQAS